MIEFKLPEILKTDKEPSTRTGIYGPEKYFMYIYRDRRYTQSQLYSTQEMDLLDIFVEVDFHGVNSLQDLAKFPLVKFLTTTLQAGISGRILSVLLTREVKIDQDTAIPDESTAKGELAGPGEYIGRLGEVLQYRPDPEEFKGLAEEFNSFYTEVLAGFFSLNQKLLAPIMRIVYGARELLQKGPKEIRSLLEYLQSLKGTRQKSERPSESPVSG